MDILPIKKRTGCCICGGKLFSIIGKYPNTPKRKICPTCAVERLERIIEICSPDYGRTAKG